MRTLALGMLAFLAGCGQAAEREQGEPPKANIAAATAESSDQPLRDISDDDLASAIGAECPKTTRTEYKGKASDRVFYAVQCGSRSFLVGLMLDGSTKILECSVAEQFGTPCWSEWD